MAPIPKDVKARPLNFQMPTWVFPDSEKALKEKPDFVLFSSNNWKKKPQELLFGSYGLLYGKSKALVGVDYTQGKDGTHTYNLSITSDFDRDESRDTVCMRFILNERETTSGLDHLFVEATRREGKYWFLSKESPTRDVTSPDLLFEEKDKDYKLTGRKATISKILEEVGVDYKKQQPGVAIPRDFVAQSEAQLKESTKEPSK